VTGSNQSVKIRANDWLCASALILAASWAIPSQAQTEKFGTFLSNYSPFSNGRPWPKFSVTSYIESRSNIWVHPVSPTNFPTVQEVSEEDSDFATVILRLPDGSTFKTYNSLVLGPYLAGVCSGDFNKDGAPDFLAIKPGSGCGIAGEYCTGVFAFSGTNGYRFTRIRTMGLGPHGLVVDPATRSFRLMHTALRSVMSLDGRYHSYWVHRFFQWDGYSFREDPNLSPVWIQYLFRPNHKPTMLLTPDLKAKAWAEDSESDSNIEW
jgi:hypothetical protein